MANRFLKNFAPRWIIFCVDIVLISVSFIFSFFLVNHLSVYMPQIIRFLPGLFTNLVISVICIIVFSIYKGIIRYSEVRDIVRIIKFAFLQFTLWVLIDMCDRGELVSANVSVALLLINLFTVIFILVAFRLLVKEVYFMAQSKPGPAHRTLIFGAGMMGQITKKVLEQDEKINTTLVGFIDDSHYKVGKKLVPAHIQSGG